ncbi:MAG: hypothetical protein GX483_07625 [Actinomycetaceae bacterium]|nr:hypothetical protein [Actinomycetaceae bacterium]
MSKMTKINAVAILTLLGLPALTMNTQVDAVSASTNAMLPELAADEWKDPELLQNYLGKRVGFYDEGVNTNIVLNDMLFGRMEHPLYTYGQDGWVYNDGYWQYSDPEFNAEFSVLLRNIQDYCEARGVVFLYVINPSKGSVYPQYLPRGYVYSNEFLPPFEQALQDEGVNYISNVEYLAEIGETELVFNKQYDSGHWNDLGAFYGTNNMIATLQEDFPQLSLQELTDFSVEQVTETSLQVSEFAINDQVEYFAYKNTADIVGISQEFPHMELSDNYWFYNAWRFTGEGSEDLPNALFFHGSYYIKNPEIYWGVFHEVYSVHNYDNLMNFEYYFDRFNPDIVLVESAEYVSTTTFFNMELMRAANERLATINAQYQGQ